MSVNHSVSDLVTMIRNGHLAKRKFITSPVSKLRANILAILKEEGYILDYTLDSNSNLQKFNIQLKYHLSKSVISEIKVISKPSRRIYCKFKDIPSFKKGLGVVILSTSKGVLQDYLAKESKVGGEILLKVF